ncbi:hypothetical protein [Klebsiella sp. BIGb0407]|uniref:hypothetical protein n=1 Tax=Klebsiella sp. BIGb0407 TaxID=2940603 RepID=UPI002167710C|nr:hypothetical protein [Klebsiella sp. BIGb0407]MCS3430390.1 ElaB/YqjD/DUF883 family membrane-anchored ribosome-binding protein [Klebsiella sp. BIGb0407]
MSHIYEQSDFSKQNSDKHLLVPTVNSPSAVSWGAIFAGAVAAASLALILLMLGAGLGLTSISAFENNGIDAGTFGIAAIAWLTFTQIAASGMGGYLAGRLRTKWVDTHTNEVYFRDTAHGFLTWALALLISVTLLTTAVSSIVGGSAKVIGSVAGGATAATVNGATNMGDASSTLSDSSMQYLTHSLFRSNAAPLTENNSLASNPPTPEEMSEVAGIFTHSITTGSLPDDDRQYLAQMISQHTGLSQNEAGQQVQSIFDKVQAQLKETKDKAQKAADEARKTTSYVTLWSFISLLIGAFVASLCATFGGRQRDL